MNIIRCAIYTRVSTEEQANKEISSLDAQEDLLINYIEKRKNQGYKLVAIYREEGISGTSLKNRVELQKLLLDAQLKKFDLVLVTDLDRIGRNLKDFVNIWDIFKNNNIGFIAINQNIDTSTITGEALIQQLMVFAELESKMNKQRAEQKRKYEITKKGRWYGGTVPLGYKYNSKSKLLIPDEKEKKIIQEIFDLYIKEESLYKVRDKINEKGYRTKTGKLFSAEAIRSILRNQIYIGKVKYKDKYYDGVHQGIIDKNKFEAVQNILDKNKSIRKSEKNNKYIFILKNLLKCGKCKSAMIGTPEKGGRFLYYRCNGNAKFGKGYCDIKFVSAEDIEKAVEWGLKEISQREDVFNRVIDKANKSGQAEVKKLEQEKLQREAELKNINQSIRIFINSLKDGRKTLGMIEDELERLEKRKNEIEREINLLEIEIKNKKKYVINRELMRKVLKEFQELYDRVKIEQRINLIRLLVRDIEYYGDKIKIRLRDLTDTGYRLDLLLNEPYRFAQRQVMLPALDTHRTTIDIDIAIKYKEINYKCNRTSKRIDFSRLAFVF